MPINTPSLAPAVTESPLALTEHVAGNIGNIMVHTKVLGWSLLQWGVLAGVVAGVYLIGKNILKRT